MAAQRFSSGTMNGGSQQRISIRGGNDQLIADFRLADYVRN
jgi:hypothetical protein